MNATSTSKKWQSTAGPIQTKRVNEAIQALSWEGKTFTELSGVKGGEERSYSFTSPFGGIRQDATDAITALAEKFDYTVTRENYQAIVAAAAEALAVLKQNRPVDDKRRTPEEEGALIDARLKAEKERKAEEEAKAAEVGAKAAELRKTFPWAASADGKLSEHARAAANMRQELALAFNGVQFRVKSDYSSISVHWSLGPTYERVKDLTGKYQHSSFDGMTDSTNYDRSVEGEAVGLVLGRVRFVSVQRDWEPGTIETVARMICDAVKVEYKGGDTREVFGEGDYNDTAADHAYRLLGLTDFGPGQAVKGVELVEWKEGQDETGLYRNLRIVKTDAASLPTATGTGGAQVRFNREHNGVEIQFPGKPAQEVIDRCKAAGFRWSKFSKVWYKKFSTYAWASAHTIAGAELQPEPGKQTGSGEPDPFDMAVEDRMAEAAGVDGYGPRD